MNQKYNGAGPARVESLAYGMSAQLITVIHCADIVLFVVQPQTTSTSAFQKFINDLF